MPLDPDPLTVIDEPDYTDHATRATGVWALVLAIAAIAGIVVMCAWYLLGRTHQ